MKTVWQDAMTSEQVLLTLLVLLTMLAGGCTWVQPAPVQSGLDSPYAARQRWAVVPPRNESGSLHADSLLIADKLAQRLENAWRIDVLPVNRTLAAMESLGLAELRNAGDAQHLLRTLGADALVVGSITAWDPYDPPKVGLLLELYTQQRRDGQAVDLRQLTRAATGGEVTISNPHEQRPVSMVSGFLDAADPVVNRKLREYAAARGAEQDDKPQWRDSAERNGLLKPEYGDWRLYRISMDLYAEFVCHEMSRRLLRVETKRLAVGSPAP